MGERKPDRREIRISRMGERVIDSGILDAEVTDAYLGDDEGEGDVFITQTSRSQPDCPHRWMEPYILCECCKEKVYCKLCFYQGAVRQCAAGHYVGPCCYRKSYLFSNKIVCKLCGAYLLDPPSLPERKA